MALDKGARGCLLVLVALVCAIYLYSRNESRKKQEVERELENRRNAVKAIGTALIERTGASREWEQALISGESFRNVRYGLHTIDVQRAWITGRPLFFSGELVDVAALGSNRIEVRLRNRSAALPFGMGYRLQMRIRCSEQVVPELMNIVESARRSLSGIVAAVLVQSVEAEVDEDETGLDDLRFVGLADCLAMDFSPSLSEI